MKKTITTLFLVIMATAMQAQTIEHIYHFNQPVISERDGYQQISFENCLPSGQVGEPTLPWQSVSLILPQGQEAVAVNVEFSDFVEYKEQVNLYPYQKPRPYSNEEMIPFAKDEDLYRSNEPYPTRSFSTVNTQYLNGVALAFCGFTPVRYVPATGKVSYARTVKVSIETNASRDDHSRMLWLTPENEASIKRLAQNSDMLDSYNKRSREINGYDMLVITTEVWIPRFGEYLNLYNGKGIRTRIVSLEEIYASMTGRDEQEQIRNYIIQEYESEGISMVSLGGDVSIVPYRSLYCWAQDEEEDQLPSDMYYACLDGTLNDDNDDRWGEVGEDDLLPELGIGRLPFNDETQFETVMHKTFSYLLEPVLGEFTSPILGAEHLGDGYYGSEDMERLVGVNNDFGYTTYGYPINYNFKRYYATPQMDFSGSGFKNLIGTGGQYVHHVGHANTGTVANWDIAFMNNDYFPNNNGTDHNFMLFHSHGCICGDFSHSCILEKMVTINTGFVVTTGNSRYGWYVPWGDGMAAHIHREFVDAYCHDHIPSVGMALREAKIATAPWVTSEGENGCLRWNIYCLNLMGDGALCPWFEEPFNPNVVFEDGLMAGSTSTTVHVSHVDTPLPDFQVSLFDGETLLSRAFTNANGDAVLTFDPAITQGTMQLIVTGQSAWPQVLEVTGINSGEAYIYGDITELESLAEFGTTLHVSGDLYNKGDVAAHNVHVAITTECEYILSHESDFTIDAFEPNSTMHFDNIGLIEIADNIPDQTIFTLNLATSLNEVTHTTQKSFLALAPTMQFEGMVIDDSEGDGNGYADPGEHITLHVNGKNAGHAMAPDAFLTIACDDDRIHFDETTIAIGNVAADGSFTADVVFSSDSNIIEGTSFYFDAALHTGSYITDYQYILSIGQVIETFESGDFSFLNWEHGGDLPWFVTDEEAHSGTYSARTGAIGDNQVSRLIAYADVLIDGEISFWFKTSTEYHKDYFAFFIDNKLKHMWSGENDWTYVSYEFDAGSHIFQWLYDTSPSGQGGSNCAWIDDINFPRSSYVTQVEEVVSDKANTLYPNPNNGSFIIELAEESDVIISNMMGQNIMNLNKVSGIQQIQINEASMYLIQLRSASGVETMKVIVE